MSSILERASIKDTQWTSAIPKQKVNHDENRTDKRSQKFRQEIVPQVTKVINFDKKGKSLLSKTMVVVDSGEEWFNFLMDH